MKTHRMLFTSALLALLTPFVFGPRLASAALASPARGTVWSWGQNQYGQLGLGSAANPWVSTPTPVSILPINFLTESVAAGWDYSYALPGDGSGLAWGHGADSYGSTTAWLDSFVAQPASPLPDGRAIASIAAGYYHAVALANDGTVWIWGQGSGPDPIQVVLPASALPVKKVGCGGYHSLALGADNNVWGWGRGASGQLGNGAFNNSATPVCANLLPQGRTVVDFDTGFGHVVVLANDGTVWSWGNNAYGELGRGLAGANSAIPGQLVLPENRVAAAISVGDIHTLALATDGSLWACGQGTRGQLGNGSWFSTPEPVRVTDLPGGRAFSRIDAGGFHNLALASDGSLWAWGDGKVGQLGNGGNVNQATPVQVLLPAGYTVVGTASGIYHNFALLSPSIAVTIHSVPSGHIEMINTTVEFSGSFVPTTSPGGYTATWVATSATGSFEFPGIVAGTSVSGTTTFELPGVYMMALRVTDSAGTTGQSDLIENDLPAYVVVYDPTGGFVTGGGWIWSPSGAFHPGLQELASVTGKASFGFVAKYLKGATVPSGNTEFIFKAGNLNFKSTAYEWLVVAGARAQYKGWGTVNGEGDYAFMLTAVDGGLLGTGAVDRFRIKIWDQATDTVIYDNQSGRSAIDELNDDTILGGGSIIIHKAN